MLWIQQNYQALIAVAGALWTLLSIINGMIKSPEAKHIIGVVLDGLSYIKRADAPGSIKLPFQMSKASRTVPIAALLPLLLIPLLVLQGCSAVQKAAWRATGIDALKCGAPSVMNAAGDALTDLLAGLSDGSLANMDPAAVGKQLAIKYGPAAALCAVGKAAANLLPTVGIALAPTPRARFIQKMLDSQAQWANVPPKHAACNESRLGQSHRLEYGLHQTADFVCVRSTADGSYRWTTSAMSARDFYRGSSGYMTWLSADEAPQESVLLDTCGPTRTGRMALTCASGW